MPFLRFSRDKRGYEHTYLVQATNRRGKPVRPRILYWYRTPPGIRLGRLPFDDEMRQTIESQNPGIVFDWHALANTPFPAPSQEPEYWRERRKAERAAKQARKDDEATDEPEPISEPDVQVIEPPMTPSEDVAMAPSEAIAPQPIVAGGPVDQSARKRRRRGGRRRRGAAPGSPGAEGSSDPDGGSAPPESPDPSSEEQE